MPHLLLMERWHCWKFLRGKKKDCARLVTAQWSVGKPSLWGDCSQGSEFPAGLGPFTVCPGVYHIQEEGVFMSSMPFCHLILQGWLVINA